MMKPIRRVVTLAALACAASGCAVVGVTDAAVSVAATTVSVGANVVGIGANVIGAAVDVARAGVRAVTNNNDQKT